MCCTNPHPHMANNPLKLHMGYACSDGMPVVQVPHQPCLYRHMCQPFQGDPFRLNLSHCASLLPAWQERTASDMSCSMAPLGHLESRPQANHRLMLSTSGLLLFVPAAIGRVQRGCGHHQPGGSQANLCTSHYLLAGHETLFGTCCHAQHTKHRLGLIHNIYLGLC